MSEADIRVQVAVVGAGQAGLSMSWLLGDAGVRHVVIERETVAHDWSDRRWDSFCLVTPNWQCQLPGWSYAGTDPDGFMLRDEIVDFLRGYAASFGPPVLEHTAVTSLTSSTRGYTLRTQGPTVHADAVVIATGGYHAPRRPAVATTLPPDLCQLHSADYVGPDALPDGAVLVVGTGQSGVQIAEDLHLAGRKVHLAVGTAPRSARSYRGRDVVAWLSDMGHYDRSGAELGNDPREDKANHYMTGRGGGHEIDLRQFATEGMVLHGHLLSAYGGQLRFAGDLRANLDHADAVAERIKDTIDAYIDREAIEAPKEQRYQPVWAPSDDEPTTLDADRLGAVVWATGFRRDDDWNRLAAFDGAGHPVHERGVSPLPGLFWLGLPWQHAWGSGRFAGVARDAAYLLPAISAHLETQLALSS